MLEHSWKLSSHVAIELSFIRERFVNCKLLEELFVPLIRFWCQMQMLILPKSSLRLGRYPGEQSPPNGRFLRR